MAEPLARKIGGDGADAGPSRPLIPGLLWPSILTLAMMALLLGLGTWQMQRLAWKTALIGRLQARVKAEPVSIDAALRQFQQDGDVEYLRVGVNGRFLHGDERYFYAPDSQSGPGYNVVTPLVVRAGAGCQDIVFVNRGYVPEALKDPATRASGQINGAAVALDGVETPVRLGRGPAVVGLVRLPEKPGTFTPANDVKRNMWFWRDISGLAASLPEKDALKPCNPSGRPYPFLIDAQAEPANPGGWPRGGTTNMVISNRHLEYALTWYGLAVTLAAVFLVYASGRLRRQD